MCGEGEKTVLEGAYQGHLGVCSNLFLDVVGYIDTFVITLLAIHITVC